MGAGGMAVPSLGATPSSFGATPFLGAAPVLAPPPSLSSALDFSVFHLIYLLYLNILLFSIPLLSSNYIL